MARYTTLKQAAEAIPGLSFTELYNGVRSGKYEGMRVGGNDNKHGKWIVDLDLLEARIQSLMRQNLRTEDEEQNQYGKLRRIHV